MIQVLIIEDEPHAASLLEQRLQAIRPSKVLAKLESVRASLNWLYNAETQPDIIFMDIELADGSSFEIFKHANIESPVVFTTAYDQYAVEAFKVNALDYLLKPISPEELKGTLERYDAREITASNELAERMEKITQELLPKRKRNRCLVKKGGVFEFIQVKDIAIAYSEDSVTFLVTKDDKRHLYSKTIEQLMEELDPADFFQINRAQIVHVENVKQIHPYLGQRLKLEVETKGTLEDVLVSRQRAKSFKTWLDS